MSDLETKSTKLQAIQLLRHSLGCSLFDAKEIVENDMFEYGHGCLSSMSGFHVQLDDLTEKARTRYLEWCAGSLHDLRARVQLIIVRRPKG